MGMDFSTGGTINIPVQAPAAGVILHTYSGCGNGYSNCGIPIGGGNNVLL
ncbi:peptidase, M23 family domain protein, partial [Clostridioides difficile P28]